MELMPILRVETRAMRPALPSDHATLLSPTSGERRYSLGDETGDFEFSSEASFRLDLLHAVNLLTWDSLSSPLKEGVRRIFSPLKAHGFDRV